MIEVQLSKICRWLLQTNPATLNGLELNPLNNPLTADETVIWDGLTELFASPVEHNATIRIGTVNIAIAGRLLQWDFRIQETRITPLMVPLLVVKPHAGGFKMTLSPVPANE